MIYLFSKTEDNLHRFLKEQELYLNDIDMSGSLYLEYKEKVKNDNTL